MAITKIDFPTASTAGYTPSISTDYNNQNEYIERNARGYNAISLTNWDTSTTKPQVAAGSVIETNGASWDITTDTDISTTGASSGTVYVVFDDATPEFKFTSTAPTWSATLNGWYVSGDRFTGHLMAWDGSSSYDHKVMYSKNAEYGGEIKYGPNMWTGEYSSMFFDTHHQYLLPKGLYLMGYSDTIVLRIKDGSSSFWPNTTVSGGMGGLIASDGTNAKLYNTSGTMSTTLFYRKIW